FEDAASNAADAITPPAFVPLGFLEQAGIQQAAQKPVQRADFEPYTSTRFPLDFLHNAVSVLWTVHQDQQDMKIGWFQRLEVRDISKVSICSLLICCQLIPLSVFIRVYPCLSVAVFSGAKN